MKTLFIVAGTAVFALTAPVEASAPAPAAPTVAAKCPAGFTLHGKHESISLTPIMVGPGDVNGDGFYCVRRVGDVTIVIDNI
jgi:hypothetical protein